MRERTLRRWPRSIILTLSVMSATFSACAPRQEPAPSQVPAEQSESARTDARLRLARTLLDEGQIGAAVEQLRRLPDTTEHRIAPGSAPVWLESIVAALLERRALGVADSLLQLTGPLAQRPAPLQALTANLQVMQGDVEMAVGTYSSIRTSDPALQVKVLHELATLHLARTEYDLALDRAREGIALAPSHQALFVLAAQALRYKGEPEAALAELAQMNASAARFAAEAELYLDVFDRPDTAVALLTRATRVVPRDPAIRQMLGRALLESGEPARAVGVLRTLAELPQPFDRSQELLARALRATGKAAPADSLDALVRARDRRQRAAELRVQGLRHSYAEENALALERFEEAIALQSDDGDLHNDRGTVLAKLQRWGEAEAAFRRAAALRPRDPVPHENLARLYDRTGDVEARDRSLDEAARLRAAPPSRPR